MTDKQMLIARIRERWDEEMHSPDVEFNAEEEVHLTTMLDDLLDVVEDEVAVLFPPAPVVEADPLQVMGIVQ